MKEADIDAIIFDIGGVLFLNGKTRFNRTEKHISGVHEKVAKYLGISIDQYFDAIDSLYTKSMEGQIKKRALLKKLSLNLETSPEKIERLYIKYYKRGFKKNKPLFRAIKSLKKRGYKVAILSDQWHLSKEVFATKKDMAIFDEVVLSCDVGMRKPNTEIYELVSKRLKVKPEKSIFVDNQNWNIIPAHKLGYKTILFKNNSKLVTQFKKFGIKL